MKTDPLKLISRLYKPHPLHGLSVGAQAPALLTCYVELVPTDTIKYEIDKVSGYLKADRPQKFSNFCPSLYGFLPQTLCAGRVGELCSRHIGRQIDGDGDALDVCILTEKDISHGDVIVQAIPIGGFRMVDKGQADDKIIAVLKDDAVFGEWKDIHDCPATVVDRLKHYFLTYKNIPGAASVTEIHSVYGREEAFDVIRRSQADYSEHYGELQEQFRLLHS
jgi:inorganic pyrophosphatase